MTPPKGGFFVLEEKFYYMSFSIPQSKFCRPFADTLPLVDNGENHPQLVDDSATSHLAASGCAAFPQ
jgi:hypothetical protein